ncbi:MAG: hypothetical protein ACTSQP_15930 [Promethearchaeota archaeon]
MLTKVKFNERQFIALIITLKLILILLYLCQPFIHIFKYVCDDAYYYFQVAKNFTEGKGIVFNENNPTNGFHPLYFYILSIIFYFCPEKVYLPIYIALFILCIFDIGTSIIFYYIGKIAYNIRTGIIASLFWTFNPYILQVILLGMETTIQLFFISLFIYYILKKNKKTNFTVKESVIIGIILMFIILSRLDGVFFTISFIFFIIFEKLKILKEINELNFKNFLKIIKQRDFLIIGFIPFIITILWILWSYFYVGTFTPISGNIKSVFLEENLNLYSYNLFITIKRTVAFPINLIYYRPGNEIIQIIFLSIFFGIPILFEFYLIFIKKDNFLLKKIEEFSFLIIPFGFFILFYWFLLEDMWPWYAMFPCFIIVLFYSFILSHLLEYINKKNHLSKRKNRIYIKIKKNIPLILFSIFLINFSFNYIDINTHYREDNYYYIHMEMIKYIEENISEDKNVGSFNTGILQYYSLKRDIINLDGVINSEAYYAHVNNNFTDFLKENNIEYLLDYKGFEQKINQSDDMNVKIVKYFGKVNDPFTGKTWREYYLWKIEFL